MTHPGRSLLLTGAIANFAVALLHVGMVLIGPPAYRYFATETLAQMAEQGSPLPAILTLILASLFAGWGAYALAGAGLLPRPPWPRAALLMISFIYLVRGSFIIVNLIYLLLGAGTPLREVFFSLTSLVIGLILLAGTILRWKNLEVHPIQ